MSAKRVEGLNRCPNCGAPLDLDPAGRCRWCEVPVEVLTPGSPDSPTGITETFQGAARPRGKARHLISALITVGVAGGLAAAQWLHAGHSPSGSGQGQDLTTAWTAASDRSSALDTVGAWIYGASLVRVRGDAVVSYDGATGRLRWTLPIPGTNVACSVSNDTGPSGAGTIGLVTYGQDSISCDHVMAVDLATGRRLWATPLQSPHVGDEPLGVLGLAGGTAVVMTDDAIIGLDARHGTKRWTRAPWPDCYFQALATSGGTAIALAVCGSASSDFYVVSLRPATGKVAWRYKITEPSDRYEFQILSASPVVISDHQTGARATAAEVRVLGPGGRVTARFNVSGIPDRAAGGPLTLDTESNDGFGVPEVIADGALVGIAQDDRGHSALVAFGLSSGQRRWVVPLPDEVNEITAGGRAQRGEVVLVDESDPAYTLEEVDMTTGKLRSLGVFGQQVFDPVDFGLYTIGNDYVVVNLHSFVSSPITAIRAPAAS